MSSATHTDRPTEAAEQRRRGRPSTRTVNARRAQDVEQSDSPRRPGRPSADTLPQIPGFAAATTTVERYKILGSNLHTLTPAACRAYLDFVVTGLRVVDAIQVERRLVAAEQAALEAGRYAQAKILGPASAVEVEVPGPQASGWTSP